MRPLPAALAALLLLAAPSLAGTPESPEITDAAGDAGAGNLHADLLAVWLADTEADLTVGFSLARLQSPPLGAAWVLIFDLHGSTWWIGAYRGLEGAGPYYGASFGQWDRAAGRPTTFEVAEVEVTEGAPAAALVRVAKPALADAAGELPAGTRLESLAATAGNAFQSTLNGVSVPPDGPVYRELDAAAGDAYALGAGAVPTDWTGNATAPAAGNVTLEGGDAPAPERTVPTLAAGALVAGAVAALRRRR